MILKFSEKVGLSVIIKTFGYGKKETVQEKKRVS